MSLRTVLKHLRHNGELKDSHYNTLINMLDNKDKYAWHDLRKNPDDLPPSRGQDGDVPDSYDLVVKFKTDKGYITVQGQGWLNDVWKEKVGFILYASQLTSENLAYYHDKPVEFEQEQLIAWREIEPFEEWKNDI